MPVNILCAFIVGSALGWILIKITRPAKQLKGLILGCCAAGKIKIFVITHYQTFFRRIDASISQDIYNRPQVFTLSIVFEFIF